MAILQNLTLSGSSISSDGASTFGNSSDDIHQFTGSVQISGSLYTPNLNPNSGSLQFWQGSQSEYNAISASADPNTVYFVV